MNLLKQRLSIFSFRLLLYSINQQTVKKIKIDKEKIHKKKLYEIWKQQKPQTPDCLVNLSSRKFNLSERNALLFGMKHHILPRSVDGISLKANIDSQVRKICGRNNIELTYDNKTDIREATEKFIHECSSICSSRRNIALHRTLKNLSSDTSIRCCKMDKGAGVVVLNTDDYTDKLRSIVNDKSRFKELAYDLDQATTTTYCKDAPWIKREYSIYSYINKYVKNLVDQHTYWKLLPRGSQPGRLYGMAKHHKKGCPLRPVLSATNTAEYGLAKWLEGEIKPFLNDKWSVDSSETFVEELNKIKPSKDSICVSFDVKSLFTMVPLQEVIEDVTKVLFDEESNSIFKTNSKITKRIFTNMLTACSESIFLFDSKVYKQIDGLAMGSPLAPLLANWFVCMVENNVLDNPSINQPILYRRYVDDVFAVFQCEQDRDLFFDHLNAAHVNLSFTMELANIETNSLPFLDVEVRITEQNNFMTKVYRKPTNTGVIMNYSAVTPEKWKRSLLQLLLSRAKKLSSNEQLFNEEVEKIRKTFKYNKYPAAFVENGVSLFFKKSDDRVTSDAAEDNTTAYLVIPYIGKSSTKLHRKISTVMQEHGVKTLRAFRTTKVESYFSLKTKIPYLFKNDVVYKFVCSCDGNTQYYGETERHFFQRIKEHCTLSANSNSAVSDHLINCTACSNNHNIVNCFSIVRQCTKIDILSQEALCIKRFEPSLNVQLGPFKGTRVGLSIFN